MNKSEINTLSEIFDCSKTTMKKFLSPTFFLIVLHFKIVSIVQWQTLARIAIENESMLTGSFHPAIAIDELLILVKFVPHHPLATFPSLLKGAWVVTARLGYTSFERNIRLTLRTTHWDGFTMTTYPMRLAILHVTKWIGENTWNGAFICNFKKFHVRNYISTAYEYVL